MIDQNTNPVSGTALVTLDYLKTTDIPYIQEFANLFHIEHIHNQLCRNPEYLEYFKVFGPIIEARLKGTDKFIRQQSATTILDIACGFTPRCMYMVKEGYTYIGADLPDVITQVKPAVASFIKQNDEMMRYSSKISYHAADATNLEQLQAAIARTKGPLTITCEGLLSYIPSVKQKEIAENIHTILSQRGGVWITSDYNGMLDLKIANMPGFVLSELETEAIYTNQQARQMLLDTGFNITDKDYLPSKNDLSSLATCAKEDQDALYEANAKWTFMIMQCK